MGAVVSAYILGYNLYYVDGLAQDRSNSSALAVLQSCTKPSM